jgi:O-antigen ligase
VTRTTIAEKVLAGAILTLGLVLSSIGGILVAYVALVLALVSIVLQGLNHPRWEWYVDPMALVLTGSFALLTIAFAVSAAEIGDVRFALNFIVFLLYIPLATVVARRSSPRAVQVVSWLAFAGAVIGAVYSLGELALSGAARAGTFRVQTDPIRLANTGLILGFLALVGLQQVKGWRRLLLLTAPLWGLATVVACGARNAMVAFPILALWCCLFLLRDWRWRVLAVSGVVTLGVIFLLLPDLHPQRLTLLITTLQELLTGQQISDTSFDIRLALYLASIPAFWDAPIFGHGWEGMMQALVPYMPEHYMDQVSLPHLHNELLNFALASGVVGVIVLFVLYLTPIWMALGSVNDSQKQVRIFGCSILLISYVVLGLADTMISYETHTALYVIWCTILLVYCRDSPEERGAGTPHLASTQHH